MSSMVKHRHKQRLKFALLAALVLAAPARSQNVSIPVVQPLPPGYRPGGEAAPAPGEGAAPFAIATVGEGSEWDKARARLVESGATAMGQAVERWRMIGKYDNLSFGDYSGFVLAYPGFPGEDKARRNAEAALAREDVSPRRLVEYFDRKPPLTNQARAVFALALSTMGRGDAIEEGRAAWRGGPVDDATLAALAVVLAGKLTPDDQDARMDALLWAGATSQAARQIALVSPGKRDLFMARLSAAQGVDPGENGLSVPASAVADAGWIYDHARQMRRAGRKDEAAALLASRPPLTSRPRNAEKWVDLQLDAARDADATTAMRIAGRIDDAFARDADISAMSYALRDDYTSLMWLGGIKALWELNDPKDAAPLFWRYGAAARTPQTRSKGFYWSGRALAMAGDAEGAGKAFRAAAKYPAQFHGQLALERLGEPMPEFPEAPDASPTEAERAQFNARPITQAVREVARASDWPTTVRFFREIAAQARTPGEHQLVADLARELGRRDLGVILGLAAEADGHYDFQSIAFPLIPVPQGSDWTMVHAISRQESQFAMNAVSHAGARGLMQLMPGTARGEAKQIGLSYSAGALVEDAGYNLTLGDSYFQRMLRYFNGSYPLAVAAYNAGPGNVNKWLRANGDPREGTVEWLDWIERIPLFETRNYVQRVLENVVVYEAMNPEKARYRGANPLSHYLGKRTPG